MATKKSSSSNGKANGTGRKGTKTTSSKARNSQAAMDYEKAEVFKKEVILWLLVAVCLLLFISNFGVGGTVGNAVSGFIFGLFGVIAYIFPIVLLIGIFFGVSNKGNAFAIVKIVSAVLFVVFLCMFMALVVSTDEIATPIEAFSYSMEKKNGGGLIGGGLAYLISNAFGVIGAYIIDIIVLIISLVLITERSAMRGVQKGSRKVYESAKETHENYVQEREKRRMDRKIAGVSTDTRISEEAESYSDEISELRPDPAFDLPPVLEVQKTVLDTEKSMTTKEQEEADTYSAYAAIDDSIIHGEFSSDDVIHKIEEALKEESKVLEEPPVAAQDRHVAKAKGGFGEAAECYHEPLTPVSPIEATKEEASKEKIKKEAVKEETIQEELSKSKEIPEDVPIEEQIQMAQKEPEKEYVFPDLSLLKSASGKRSGNTQQELKETAVKLQQTLQTFGVNVTVTNISCGPAVTRYEIQPEMGVKVSKIVNLADDIKLNLAAADIRIEAPIPGKAAVGIEVPNKENVMVPFRELLESSEFEDAESKISFAVGKDIAGKVTVTDIAKMPHVLIAGATGSGKSVCINTIIMSILYKADPADVKLIMIDPKVVELSVYNGIPHLMVPVVTDPKKASAALHWAVAEMTERYKKFADLNVRDLKGYNKAVEAGKTSTEGEALQKMPQLVIIVDELADLMMVAAGEVEESICRLAQLARAAGIHLIIATQRPSVDVITGLIKANMPSRVAFSVSSGVDSRTILDMNGAEKLLGKGDMLFYPQGYSKPARVQGAFVSDSEVSEVVDFLKNQMLGNTYDVAIEEKIKTIQTSVGSESANGGVGDYDAYFADAGRFVIEKDKASIGMLQRVFKIGFNRAARIVDQLEAAGVVGAEEGTKPRKILMSIEQFENYLDEAI